MGGKELIIRKPNNLNVTQEAARATLREVQNQGHPYIELREVGRRTIFFCTICLTPCYSDTVLFDHLQGNLHTRRLAAAKATLFGPVPWPFNDGVLFFSTANHDQTVKSSSNGVESHRKYVKDYGSEEQLNIPRVLSGNRSSNVKVCLSGYGHMASRISKIDVSASNIFKIWCAWLGAGKSDAGNSILMLPRCEFGVVNFSYSCDLGRPCDWDIGNSSISSESCLQLEKPREPKRRKESNDDADADDHDDDGRNGSMVPIVGRNVRKELRKQKRLAAERLCDICGHSMLESKDVATLLNRKTWKIACSSRNNHSAFHVFHTSCLIHWILLCESEVWNPKPNRKGNRGRKGKKAAMSSLSSILCPECQGTGIITEEYNLEKPSIPLAQMFEYKLKAVQAHKAWMKRPETLDHCSTGLVFFKPEDNAEEQILPLKLLHFYQAL